MESVAAIQGPDLSGVVLAADRLVESLADDGPVSALILNLPGTKIQEL
jgi:hypothetical protein